MNFRSRWRAWIMATLQSARASVLVNGSPTREFDCSRGLRQGDPLSPFLFVIAMEALTGIMKKATAMGLFNGIKISNEAPIKVLESLDRIRRVFFWGGSEEKARMNWVAWDKTIAPVEYGGLGFGSLRDANLAMLEKWWWRFKTEKNGLWRRVIWAIHHNSRGWKDIPIKVSVAGPWKSIASIRNLLLTADIDLNVASRAVLANCKNISFWLDCWADSEPFYLMFPDLFKAALYKDCLVHDCMKLNGSRLDFNWAWKSTSLGNSESNQLQQ
ncbi:uncharacterized protein LOC110943654 [Helianthus annuus]|uniref:uncharacterized protein LOC110943654 n=1 Tax=Helianthus annuus TaxID=4232 RepID=UPI000B8F9D23|nr:uncharacterized protein LOC110943654 [Helianthus annuus]